MSQSNQQPTRKDIEAPTIASDEQLKAESQDLSDEQLKAVVGGGISDMAAEISDMATSEFLDIQDKAQDCMDNIVNTLNKYK